METDSISVDARKTRGRVLCFRSREGGRLGGKGDTRRHEAASNHWVGNSSQGNVEFADWMEGLVQVRRCWNGGGT